MAGLLCIDLGSSYTKVALRRDENATSELIRDPHLESEFEYCIPSAVAKIRRNGQSHWLFGEQAVDQAPGANVSIYQDWKAQFFSADSVGETEEVARQFFVGLAEHLKRLGHEEELSSCRARICIPKMEYSLKVGHELMRLAKLAGFKFAAERPCIFEPEANVCGVLTRGTNATWRPKDREPLHPHYHRMFVEGTGAFFARLKRRVLPGNSFMHSVLVVDVGSFTTDLGLVTFEVIDREIDNLHKPRVAQESFPIGVRELDRAVLDGLPAEVREAIASRPQRDWEITKRLIYGGQSAAIRKAGGGIVNIKSERDQRVVKAAIAEFAGRVNAAIQDFCRENSAVVEEAIVTGGGSMIPSLRVSIVDALQERYSERAVLDLLDPDEPLSVIADIPRPGGWQRDQPKIDQRLKVSRELVRAGSAIGGSSVFVDHPPAANQPQLAENIRR